MVMAYVDPHGIRLSEIARRQFVSRQAIHRIVTDLRDLGLLELRVDAQNKSAKLVVATERGNRCIADAKRIFSELEDELANAIGRDEVESLREKLISARNATRHPTPSPAKNYVAGGVDL
jgi:DNA-binding MarR family transcriptional regulator